MGTCTGTCTTAAGLTSALSAASTATLRVLLSSNASSGTAYGTGADSDTSATTTLSASQRVAITGAASSSSSSGGVAGGRYAWPGRFSTKGSLVLLRVMIFKQKAVRKRPPHPACALLHPRPSRVHQVGHPSLAVYSQFVFSVAVKYER